MLPNVNNQSNLTTNYKYSNYEAEYIFSCKARPFAVLVSSFLPTPPASLIDYDLVRDLNLKMTDIQCKKFSFAGNKLRILGSVSTSVQCVHNGRLIGNHHIRARVVSDLNKTFDTHCIAGDRLKQQLRPTHNNVQADYPEEDSADDDDTSKKPQSPKPTGSSWQNRTTSHNKDVKNRRPRVSDVDGGAFDVSHAGGGAFDVSHAGGGTFDVSHAGDGAFDSPKDVPSDDDDLSLDGDVDVHLQQACDDPKPIPAKDIAEQANFTASQANSYSMVMAFGDADLARTEEEARRILFKHCPCGAEEESEPVLTFTHYDGYLFQFGHGRNKCSRRKCLSQAQPYLPSNCVFNDQWCLPRTFSFCSQRCQGGFCSCLQNYPSQDGDYI